MTPANRIPLVQNGTVDLECSTTTNTTARAQQVEFAPTHFVGSIAAATKKLAGKSPDFWDLGTAAPWQFALMTEIVDYVCWIGGHTTHEAGRRARFAAGRGCCSTIPT